MLSYSNSKFQQKKLQKDHEMVKPSKKHLKQDKKSLHV